jgi:hypothetical protein
MKTPPAPENPWIARPRDAEAILAALVARFGAAGVLGRLERSIADEYSVRRLGHDPGAESTAEKLRRKLARAKAKADGLPPPKFKPYPARTPLPRGEADEWSDAIVAACEARGVEPSRVLKLSGLLR